MNGLKIQSTILPQQVWGLVALLTAIVLSWIAYGVYQPQLLHQLGFIWLAANLGILQGFLGAVVEPIVGSASDHILRQMGSRLPMLATGAALAGLIVVTTVLLVHQQLPGEWRWLIPVLMTIWVTAITVLRSPAIALLQQLTPTTELLRVNALLALVFGLLAALGLLVETLLRDMGASLTFLLGAGTLVTGALLLYSPPAKPHLAPLPAPSPEVPLQYLRPVFGLGLGVGTVTNLALRVFPAQAADALPGCSPAWITAGILLISALIALPLEIWILRLGIGRSLRYGLLGMTGLLGLALLPLPPGLIVGLAIAQGIPFGLVLMTQIPYTLRIVPLSQAGLSIGLYLGGISAGTSLISLLLTHLGQMSLLLSFLWAISGLFTAALCITSIRRAR